MSRLALLLLLASSSAAVHLTEEQVSEWQLRRSTRLTSNPSINYVLYDPYATAPSGLCTWAREHLVDDSYLLLTFATHEYTDIVLNWAAALSRFGVRGAVFALDSLSATQLASRGIDVYDGSDPAWTETDYADLWAARMDALLDLLECGVRVAMVDADAVFTSAPEWPQTTSIDIWLSQGTFPQDVYSKWGTAGCMGFALFESNARTVSLVRAVLADVQSSGDDQVSTNRILLSRGLDPAPPEEPAALVDRYGCLADDGLCVAFLPTAIIPRDCDTHVVKGVQPMAMHCLTRKSARSKESDMRKRGLWFID